MIALAFSAYPDNFSQDFDITKYLLPDITRSTLFYLSWQFYIPQ